MSGKNQDSRVFMHYLTDEMFSACVRVGKCEQARKALASIDMEIGIAVSSDGVSPDVLRVLRSLRREFAIDVELYGGAYDAFTDLLRADADLLRDSE